MLKKFDFPVTTILTVILTIIMLWPIDQPPYSPYGSDKLLHLSAFAVLAFPLARTGRVGLLPLLVGGSTFGGAIELVQPSFNRSADINDWIADVIGVIVGIACGLLYRQLRRT